MYCITTGYVIIYGLFRIGVPLDTLVLTVRATDTDTRDPVHRIVSGNIGSVFRMDPFTGAIRVARSLDRESIPVFNLGIEAIDDGGNIGATLVRVVVTDVNDEAPLFREFLYTASVPENSPEGTAVLPFVDGASVRIQAIDADEPNTLNSLVLYRLEGEDVDSFSIDSVTGIVTVARGIFYHSL